MGIAISLVLSVLALLFFRFYMNIKLSEQSILAVTFLPTLLVWADGRISEFNAFGIGAKFNPIAEKKIEILFSDQGINVYMTKSEALRRIDASYERLSQGAYFQGCHDFIFVRPSMVPKSEHDFSRHALAFAQTIVASSACGRFVGVIVLDEDNRYLGSYDKGFFYELGSLWALADPSQVTAAAEVWQRISSYTVAGAAIKYPDVRLKSGEGFIAAVSEATTVKDFLKEFQRSGANFIVVTDAYGKLQGIIQHRQFIDLLILNLMQNGKTSS